jgi:hypothetical protein
LFAVQPRILAAIDIEHPTLAMSAVKADIKVGSRAAELETALRRMAKLSGPGG